MVLHQVLAKSWFNPSSSFEFVFFIENCYLHTHQSQWVMYRFSILLAFWLGTTAFGYAQNLVSNYSFETNSGCPTGPCEWQRPTGWNNVNMLTGCGSYGTPDYFHTCGAGFSHLPYNGYITVNPHTGNAVMGFLTWSGSLSPNFREL